MNNNNYSSPAQISTTIKRIGHIIMIEGTGSSITFYPNDKDKTFNAIILKCKELGSDLTLDDDDAKTECHNIDIQLTQIYREYYEERKNRKITDAQHLVNLVCSEIKEQFKDETGAFYAVIQKEEDGHKEVLNMDHQEFDLFLSRTFYTSESEVLKKETCNNAKRLLKSFTTQKKHLHNRIAKVGNDIYYDLEDESWQCIKISREEGRWSIVDNPVLFRRPSGNRRQVYPIPDYHEQRRYLKEELIDKSTIKHEYQKLIAEVYTISLFIPGITHPMIIPIGLRGSGKTILLRLIKLIVDPEDELDALVQRLPRDEKDRRVNIYGNYVSYFDNESALSNFEMDELCSWVTGFSGTVRTLFTTDESRTYSGKRIIGINGINMPISNADAINRAFVLEMEKVADGSEGDNAESKLIPENEIIDNMKKLIPEILAYIFDIIVKVLQKYEEVRKEIKPNHRLADFVIYGEAISRVIGNENNAFLKAWQLNTNTQNMMVIRNSTLAELILSYAFNERPEMEFEIEPEELFMAVKQHARKKGIDYDSNQYLPKSSAWLSRQINGFYADLKVAGLVITPDIQKDHKRYIGFKKDFKANTNQQSDKQDIRKEQPQQQTQLEENRTSPMIKQVL